jgi:hypothetical protein
VQSGPVLNGYWAAPGARRWRQVRRLVRW